MVIIVDLSLHLQLGIGNYTHIVVYDNNAKFGFYSAGRVWWMFKVHDMVTKNMHSINNDLRSVNPNLCTLSSVVVIS